MQAELAGLGTKTIPKYLMQRAFVGMVASGTATLEATFYRLPFVLIYKVSWLTYVPGRMLIRVDHLGMPNILAGDGQLKWCCASCKARPKCRTPRP